MQMHLKIFDKNNLVVTDIRTGKRRRILYFIQADRTPNARFFIKVTYAKGFTNTGEYFSKNDLLLAFDAFMEK